MRSTEEITTDINKLESEVNELETRRDELEDQLSEIKDDYSMLLDADEVQEKISSVTTNRELISEAIQERKEKLNELRAELEKAESKEVREQRLQRCIELAQKADAANKEYRKLFEDLDEELLDKMLTIAKAQQKWANAANTFVTVANKLEPAVKTRYQPEDMTSRELEEAAENLIEEIEETGNVDTGAARSEIYCDYKFYRIHKKNGRELKPNTDHFGWAIFDMLKKVNRKILSD
jgi:chromosome segregation ATPase